MTISTTGKYCSVYTVVKPLGSSHCSDCLLGFHPFTVRHHLGGGGSRYPVSLSFVLEISRIPLIVHSRIPKLRVEYPHISFSNILYPYHFSFGIPYPYTFFPRISRIPITPNGPCIINSATEEYCLLAFILLSYIRISSTHSKVRIVLRDSEVFC